MPYPGQPKDTPIPPHLRRWNWGAFLLNWIWGLGNSTFIALLMFVPLVNFVMPFVLGAKGSEWAWKNRLWEDEEHFVRVQRNWARAGLAMLVALPLFLALLLYGVSSIITNSHAYELSLDRVKADSRVIEAMGTPIVPGWFTTGQISVEGPDGAANLSIPISGPVCDGDVISRSTKANGEWKIYLLFVKLDCSPSTIVLINENNIVIPHSNTDT
jgi:hypothetical protein